MTDSSFLGGSEPNLADLNVYGILTAIQGCEAFQDLMANTKIQPWFERMKHVVEPQLVTATLPASAWTLSFLVLFSLNTRIDWDLCLFEEMHLQMVQF